MQKPTNSAFSGAICALVIMAVLVLGCGRFLGSKDGVKSGDVTKIADSVSTFDPKAPLTSPGAEVIRRLSKLDPKLALFAADIESVERGTMKKAIDDLAIPPKAGMETEKTIVMSPSQRFFSSASASSEKEMP